MNNEIQRLHFEIKRINVQLDSLRTYLKSFSEEIANLKAQAVYRANVQQPVSEAVPEGVSSTVQGAGP